MSENITNILKNITSRPGIYKFLDSKSKIIYIGKALNLKKRIYNNALNVSGMVPAAYMGVGQSVQVELGRASPEENISGGTYIVSDINHIFKITDEGAGMDYVQNVKLLREYA